MLACINAKAARFTILRKGQLVVGGLQGFNDGQMVQKHAVYGFRIVEMAL